MKEISLLDATQLTSPNPVTLVCSFVPADLAQARGEQAGFTNLATISWWMPLSVEPEIIGFAMMKTSFSGELIRSSREAILTIPGEPLAKQVMQCGCSTGRKLNKAAHFAIELKDFPDSQIRITEHSVAAIHCQLREYHDVGDHYLHICNVLKTISYAGEKALFAWNGYSKIAPANM